MAKQGLSLELDLYSLSFRYSFSSKGKLQGDLVINTWSKGRAEPGGFQHGPVLEGTAHFIIWIDGIKTKMWSSTSI